MTKQSPDTQPRAYASGIPVYCAYDKIIPIGQLKPNPRNPNKHPQDQLEKLGKIIRGNGWRNPITVSTRSGLIVKGHGRMMAAELEEFKEVPVEFQNYESEEAELADLTADNRIAELSEMDTKMLADIFADIDTGAIDFELSGYSDQEYEKLATALADMVDKDMSDPDDDPKADTVNPTRQVTRRGDIWIMGDDRQMTIEVGYDAEDILLSFVDGVVSSYIRTTGSTEVKCIRNGEELPSDEIEDVF